MQNILKKDLGLKSLTRIKAQCIRKVNTELRFDIGEEVQCWYNERWERGRVVQHYEEPQAVFHPYQVELHNNVLIYAPKDDDDHIQIARRFEEAQTFCSRF